MLAEEGFGSFPAYYYLLIAVTSKNAVAANPDCKHVNTITNQLFKFLFKFKLYHCLLVMLIASTLHLS